ncbi:MAG: hypothetical protein JWN05_3265 [Arthrobacter sp.]|nr:hypothetical protein [Arthrobacter sp.]
MAGEKDLRTLLATMHPVRRDGEYVHVLWPHGKELAGGIAAAVREAEGLTVVMPRAEADGLGLSYDFVGAWVTLQVHSSLEAVGLTAAVSAALTDAGISCNVLAGVFAGARGRRRADPGSPAQAGRGQRPNPARGGAGVAQRTARRTARPSWPSPPRRLPSRP